MPCVWVVCKVGKDAHYNKARDTRPTMGDPLGVENQGYYLYLDVHLSLWGRLVFVMIVSE